MVTVKAVIKESSDDVKRKILKNEMESFSGKILDTVATELEEKISEFIIVPIDKVN